MVGKCTQTKRSVAYSNMFGARTFNNLKNCVGDDCLAGYVKTMELTLLLEAWLNKDERV